MLSRKKIAVAGTLLLGLTATELRYYHGSIKPLSACLFQGGLCGEEQPIRLDEGRLNFTGLTSTDTSSLSVQLTGTVSTISRVVTAGPLYNRGFTTLS